MRAKPGEAFWWNGWHPWEGPALSGIWQQWLHRVPSHGPLGEIRALSSLSFPSPHLSLFSLLILISRREETHAGLRGAHVATGFPHPALPPAWGADGAPTWPLAPGLDWGGLQWGQGVLGDKEALKAQRLCPCWATKVSSSTAFSSPPRALPKSRGI